jgi:O-antigen ligase
MVALGGLLFFSSAPRGVHVDVAGLSLAAYSVLSFGFVITRDADWMPFLAAAAILPAIRMRDGITSGPIKRALIDSMRIIAMTALLLAAIAPGRTFGPCRLDKCSVFQMQLGSLGDANSVGMTVAVIGVLAAQSLQKRSRIVPYLIAVAAIVDLSVSRSALLPLALGTAAVLAYRFLPRRSTRVALAALVCVGVVAILVVAMGTWSRNDFTGRGSLWVRAQKLIAEQPIFGYGSSFWVRQTETSGVVANYSTHNVLLEVLLSAGAIGLLLICIAIVAAARGRSGGDDGLFDVALIVWLAAGVTEVFALPGRLYLLPAMFPLLFILARLEKPFPKAEDSGRAALQSEATVASARLRRRPPHLSPGPRRARGTA